MAANILAGLGAGLQGGLRAFQNAQALEEEKRQFNTQQDLQNRLLQRSLMRDELDELKQEEDAKQAAFTRAITLSQQFGGQKVPEGAVSDLPDNLRALVSKAAEPTLPSTQIGGYSNTAGGKQEGVVGFEEKAGTPAGMVEINQPESERLRIALLNEQGRLNRSQEYGDLQRELQRNRGDQQTALANLRGDIARDVANIRVDAANARFNAMPMLIQTVDAQGNPTTRVATRGTLSNGQEFASKPTAEQVNRKDAQGKAAKIFDTIDRLSQRINVNEGIIAKATGGAEKLKAQANLNDDVAGYEAMISGFTPLIARAVGHVGVLTEQDVQSVRALFPAPGDSKSLRDRKIAQIKYLMSGSGPALAGVDNPNSSFTDVLNNAGVKTLTDAPVNSGGGSAYQRYLSRQGGVK